MHVQVLPSNSVVLVSNGQVLHVSKGANGQIVYPFNLTDDLIKRKVEDAFLALETNNPHVYEE